MPYVITATDPKTRETFYLQTTPEGVLRRTDDINDATTWETHRDLWTWVDTLDDATLARLETRTPVPIEVTSPALQPGVTTAELAEAVAYKATKPVATPRLPKKRRTV